MSATPAVGITNPIVTRQRKRRDLETTMTTLKQLLEPKEATKKGSRKKNKPRSIAKKVVPPKKVSRFENIDEGEYYPNKLKRKVRLKKTVLRPKHELKVVVATNKRKRCTPHRGLDPTTLTTSGQSTFNINSIHTNDTSNNSTQLHIQTTDNHNSISHTESVNVTTKISQNSVYKLISPPHKSLTQLTVDDLIRMDEDSLSGEDMMEILTCPSPVWWEDPTDVAHGTVYLTQASELSSPVIENSEENTRHERIGLKRGSICVSASKARKIAKLENILGHIKGMVRDDVSNESIKNVNHNKTNKDNDTDNVNKIDKNESVTLEAITRVNTPEVNEISGKRRKISFSGSDISVNEDELLWNLENMDIPIEKVEDKDSRNVNNKDDGLKNCVDIPVDVETIFGLNDNEKEQQNITVATPNKTKLQRVKKKTIKKKIESPVAKKQMNKGKQRNNDRNKKDTKNNVPYANNKEKPIEPDKSEPKLLENDILDVRLIKVPTNVTNEVRVWSTLQNFKRHNLTPSDFQRDSINIEDEYEIPISTDKNKDKDPLDIKDETILIDDDSNDFVNTGIDVVGINVIENRTAISPATDITSYNSEVIELDRKDICSEERGNKERNIIKEDTIRIGNDLDIKLIETSDVQDRNKIPDKQNVEISKIKLINMPKENTESDSSANISAPIISKSEWHVNNYLKFDDKTNERGIFRVDDTDDANDTILCLNDVDVSLVKNPRLKDNDKTKVKFDESINDLSITLVSSCTKATFTMLPKISKVVTESPISVKSNTSESNVENSDTISDTNIHFLDEYEDTNVHKQKSDAITDKTKIDSQTNKADKDNVIDLELDQETIDVDCIASDKTQVDDDITDYEDDVNIDEGK